MAGLLDYLYDPSTYGGNGGLLGRLAPSLGTIPQSQGFPQQDQGASFNDRWNALAPQLSPSGRTFDAATFDPSTYAPSQPNNPIAVGNYQMPRLGNPDQYVPQQVMTPPNAQPAQGQIPQQPMQQPMQGAQPQFMQADQPGFAPFYQSLKHGGGLIGSIIAGVTGQRSDPLGVQQQNLKAQFEATRQALISNGVSPSQAASTAMLSVMNPEAAKTVLPELLTNKEKYQVVSEDPFAGKKYGFVNERDQTVNGQPLSHQGQAMGSSSPLADMERAKAAGVQGEALYEYLPKQIAPMVKAMIEGRQPLPSGAAMRNPATLALIDAAHSVDPTFDATSWGARAAGAKDFTSGKSAEMVRAANQTLDHVGSLLDAMDKLGNTRFPMVNAVKNYAGEATGAGEPGSFRTNAHAVAEEMSKVFKGANLSDSEIRHWEQNLSENMSPEQQKAQIAKLSELLHGSLAALEEKRTAALGPMAAAKAGPIIKEEGQRVLDRIDNWLKGNNATAANNGIEKSAIEAEMRRRGLLK